MRKNNIPVCKELKSRGITGEAVSKWWTSHDRKWAFNSETRELIKFPDFQFPGRKELEERDAGSRT
nr:MAG TPA: hypothetical protein [Caudoviricetes sp.]